MTAQTASQLRNRLRTLKEQRREQEIDLRTYYQELLILTRSLVTSLAEEVEQMDEEEIYLQVPLILLFVEEQIQRFRDRE